MGYIVRIEKKNLEKINSNSLVGINLGFEDVVSVKYNLKMVGDKKDDKIKEKKAELEINGKILSTPTYGKNDAILKVAKWALETSNDRGYIRDVTILVYASGELIRTLRVPDVEITEFQEFFTGTTDVGTFILKMKQSDSNAHKMRIIGDGLGLIEKPNSLMDLGFKVGLQNQMSHALDQLQEEILGTEAAKIVKESMRPVIEVKDDIFN